MRAAQASASPIDILRTVVATGTFAVLRPYARHGLAQRLEVLADLGRHLAGGKIEQVTRKGVGEALLQRGRLGQLERGLVQTLPGGCTHGVPGSLAESV